MGRWGVEKRGLVGHELSGGTKRGLAVGAAVCMCALVGWQSRTLPDPEGTEEFHAAVREVVSRLPSSVGGWVSYDVPPTPGAVQLLKPNVLHQRRWVNASSNEVVTVLVVHCGDTRDMLGHYPPVCYVGQGMSLASKGSWVPMGVSTGLTGEFDAVPEYEFVAVRGAKTEGVWVRNAMLLPGVGLGRDMADVQNAARNVTRRYFGAGQIQLVFPHEYTARQRERITREMLAIYRDVLETVSGPTHVGSAVGVGAEASKEVP